MVVTTVLGHSPSTSQQHKGTALSHSIRKGTALSGDVQKRAVPFSILVTRVLTRDHQYVTRA